MTPDPTPTTPLDELRAKLEAEGFGGLYCTEDPCGCELSDLAPCGMPLEGDEGVLKTICWPGYRFTCIGPECAQPCDVGGGKSYATDWCICKSKEGLRRREPDPVVPMTTPLEEYESWKADYDPYVLSAIHADRLADAAIESLKQRAESAERLLAEANAKHAVEVTGILRSVMGYLTALTASSSDMVTFVAQKLNPYLDGTEPNPEGGPDV